MALTAPRPLPKGQASLQHGASYPDQLMFSCIRRRTRYGTQITRPRRRHRRTGSLAVREEPLRETGGPDRSLYARSRYATDGIATREAELISHSQTVMGEAEELRPEVMTKRDEQLVNGINEADETGS